MLSLRLQRNEIITTVCAAAAAYFILAGYELIRGAANVLYKTAYGAENLPLVMACVPIGVVIGLSIYARLLSRFGPRRTFMMTGLGSGVLIYLSVWFAQQGYDIATAILFIVREFYIVLLLEQLWSYVNSCLRTESAKKLNGGIAFIGGLGALSGDLLVSQIVGDFGTHAMIMIGAVFVIPAVLIIHLAYQRQGEPVMTDHQADDRTHLALGLFRESKVLRYLFSIVVLTQIVSTVLSLNFEYYASATYVGDMDGETAFQSQFWAGVNLAGLILQGIVAPLLLSWASLRWIHLAMPLIHVVSIAYAIYSPSLFSIALAFFLFKTIDYSIFRVAKEILYIPLTFDGRFRAKQVIDVFGYRTSKGMSSVMIVICQRLGVIVSNYYSIVAMIAVGAWLWLVLRLIRSDQNVIEPITTVENSKLISK